MHEDILNQFRPFGAKVKTGKLLCDATDGLFTQVIFQFQLQISPPNLCETNVLHAQACIPGLCSPNLCLKTLIHISQEKNITAKNRQLKLAL